MSGMKFEKEIFMKYLIEREASEATKKKYMTDVTTFYSYAAEAEEIDKELLLAYREWLMQHYAVSSVNSMLVALRTAEIRLYQTGAESKRAGKGTTCNDYGDACGDRNPDQ